jgi:general secretion pathway protein G
MKVRTNRRARRAGFTLTEMLIVLAILVMLVALVVPRFLGAQKRADRQTAQAQIGLLRGALERYAMDTKNFPMTEQGLQALVSAPGDAAAGDSTAGETTTGTATSWDGPYINKEEIPRDPWGNEYQYVFPPERGSGDLPDIWSYGPDGEDNTEDDICSWSATAGGDTETGPAENLDIKVDVDFGER